MYEYRAKSIAEGVRLALDSRVPFADVIDCKRTAKSRASFEFGQHLRKGPTLFVGEGNFSFSLSFARRKPLLAKRYTATSYEEEDDLCDAAYTNARKLIAPGARVRTGVDATRLDKTFGRQSFDMIIFQFPNTASRDPLYSQNPNHVLVTRFLKSSTKHLRAGGMVVISTVDSPFYEGAFKMEEAARKAGFAAPKVYNFSPSSVPGYAHQNTANEGTALEDHDAFATWVFSPRSA